MQKSNKAVKVIGLTGGVAAGKTTAARIFRRLGAKIIDADQINRELLAPHSPLWRKVVSSFGQGIVRSNGAINMKLLGKMVFADSHRRRELEQLSHPPILREIKRRIKACRAAGRWRIIVVEAPLLFESGADRMVDCSVVIWAPQPAQIERLKIRNGLDARTARQRIAAHWKNSRKIRGADLVIKNGGRIGALDDRIRKLWGVLTKGEK